MRRPLGGPFSVRSLVVPLGLFLAMVIGLEAPADAELLRFNRDIRPILSSNCFHCHGPDHNTREAGLRLDTAEGALAERLRGAAVVPGQPDASQLVRRITAEDSGIRMPPPDSGYELTEEQIQTLRTWIEQGAAYEDHWAYAPVVRPEVPEGRWPEMAGNPIDHFIQARLAEEGLEPSPEADRRTLLRRLSFDLTGLPPTPEQLEAFLEDERPGAYQRAVERLLGSPHYGERMAAHWLDLVRYADTVGFHGDQPVSLWPYRDYVIRAFNENMPFDQFTIEQLAGDLLDEPTLDQQVASGYNRLNRITAEGGAQADEYLAIYAADRVRTTSTAWLGATLGCAECHDHKYDPYTAEDFYSFAAFFADIEEQGVFGGFEGRRAWGSHIRVPDEQQQAELERLDELIAQVKSELEQSTDELAEGQARGEQRLAKLEEEKESLEESIPTMMVARSVEPRTVRILPRGDWMDDSGPVVQPAVPRFLPQPDDDGQRRLTRLDLARWLVSDENPKTARVFVNRLWYLYFGQGLSEFLDDLGSQGSWPSHPELLDWLADEFVQSGWDVKHMVRLIVNSGTYRQSSLETPQLREVDPQNRLLARQSRFRLDAEMVRDQALAAAGLLSDRIGGRSVKPYQPAGYYDQLNFPRREYQQDEGEQLYRRTVYTHWQRTFLHPSLQAFDAPSREECTAQRTRSNIPQQALVLLNDPIYVEAARVLAEQLLRQDVERVEERIEWALHRTLHRTPYSEELSVLAELYAKHRDHYEADRGAAEALVSVGEWPVPEDLDVAELAAWTSVARTLLNLHETIYRD